MKICDSKWQMFYLLLLTWPFVLISNEKAVTNSPRCDGFGSQFLAIIGSVIDAELKGCNFMYTPFSQMEHNYSDDPNYLVRKEWLINFINNFSIARLGTPYAQCNYHHMESGGKVIAESKSLSEIKKIFRLNKKITDYLDANRFNIAIHVRRHNSHDSRIDGTDTPDQTFLEVIAILRKKYKNKNPLFYIFSQGQSADFKQYETEDIILRLNESVEDTFSSMVFADVLVTARSAFSYVAGLLSEGIVYYIPFGCQSLPHWISIGDLLKCSRV